MKLVVDFILISGMVLNLLAIAGLMRVKTKKLPQSILIVFWLSILSIFIYFYASLHELHTLKLVAYSFENGVRLFVPPLIYLYIKSIFYQKTDLIQQHLIHFVPFALFFVFYNLPITFGFYFPYIETLDNYTNWGLIHDLYGILYFMVSLKLYYTAKKTIKRSYADFTQKDFLWLEKFLLAFLIVLIIDLLITVNEMYFGYIIFWDAYITVFFLLCAMIYIGYYGLTQSTIFLPSFLAQEITLSPSKKTPSLFSDENTKQQLRTKFNALMKQEKLYLQQDLNLKILADHMSISPRMLSAFFSELMESNFYDAINYHRVEEAKRKLRTKALKNYTITGIALSCGFRSKSSFYRVFKKQTGVSPSAYTDKTLNASHDTQWDNMTS